MLLNLTKEKIVMKPNWYRKTEIVNDKLEGDVQDIEIESSSILDSEWARESI